MPTACGVRFSPPCPHGGTSARPPLPHVGQAGGGPPEHLHTRLPGFGPPPPRTHPHEGQGSTTCTGRWTLFRPREEYDRGARVQHFSTTRLVNCCLHAPASCACAGMVAPPCLRRGTPPLCLERRAIGVPSVLPEWRAPRLRRPCPWAPPPLTAPDAPRVEVDRVHDAAAVRLRLDAEDALRAFVLHETQGIVDGGPDRGTRGAPR